MFSALPGAFWDARAPEGKTYPSVQATQLQGAWETLSGSQEVPCDQAPSLPSMPCGFNDPTPSGLQPLPLDNGLNGFLPRGGWGHSV